MSTAHELLLNAVFYLCVCLSLYKILTIIIVIKNHPLHLFNRVFLVEFVVGKLTGNKELFAGLGQITELIIITHTQAGA